MLWLIVTVLNASIKCVSSLATAVITDSIVVAETFRVFNSSKDKTSLNVKVLSSQRSREFFNHILVGAF
jgi:hypothetical protein